MYQLDFLPIAKEDIYNIIYYITNTLKNKTAAINMSQKIIEVSKIITKFPYGSATIEMKKKLKNDYRCIRINNYLMFYTINEKEHIITVVRVLYQKMNFDDHLK